MRASWLLVMVSVWLGACSTVNAPKPGDPQYAPVVAPSALAPAPTKGAIYRADFGINNLFSDRKAYQVGDLLTITLTERTVSRKSNSVSVTKDSDISMDADPVLGITPQVGNFSMDTQVGQERDFSGEGEADQSNSLQGNITVTVAEVLPNGNLIVRGEKWLTLNRGEEFIRISGIVRPEDISTDNSVASTRLANARIAYSGTGELADSNRMGWLSRFFNSEFWPL